MGRFSIYHSARFDKELVKYDEEFQRRVDKIEDKLLENPNYGTPLGVKWFREARYEGYRIYYLIYEEYEAIFMVAISNKKDQQKTINTIRLLLGLFKTELENILKENKRDEDVT